MAPLHSQKTVQYLTWMSNKKKKYLLEHNIHGRFAMLIPMSLHGGLPKKITFLAFMWRNPYFYKYMTKPNCTKHNCTIPDNGLNVQQANVGTMHHEPDTNRISFAIKFQHLFCSKRTIREENNSNHTRYYALISFFRCQLELQYVSNRTLYECINLSLKTKQPNPSDWPNKDHSGSSDTGLDIVRKTHPQTQPDQQQST